MKFTWWKMYLQHPPRYKLQSTFTDCLPCPRPLLWIFLSRGFCPHMTPVCLSALLSLRQHLLLFKKKKQTWKALKKTLMNCFASGDRKEPFRDAIYGNHWQLHVNDSTKFFPLVNFGLFVSLIFPSLVPSVISKQFLYCLRQTAYILPIPVCPPVFAKLKE